MCWVRRVCQWRSLQKYTDHQDQRTVSDCRKLQSLRPRLTHERLHWYMSQPVYMLLWHPSIALCRSTRLNCEAICPLAIWSEQTRELFSDRTDNVIITGNIIMLRLMLLFVNYFLGGPEVLDLQFRNAQREPYTLCLRKKGPPWNTLELCQGCLPPLSWISLRCLLCACLLA